MHWIPSSEEEKQQFDFVVSRAVMPLADLIKIIKKNISPKQQISLPNGLICLKGGELEHETMPFKHKTVIQSLSDSFEEERRATSGTMSGQASKHPQKRGRPEPSPG